MYVWYSMYGSVCMLVYVCMYVCMIVYVCIVWCCMILSMIMYVCMYVWYCSCNMDNVGDGMNVLLQILIFTPYVIKTTWTFIIHSYLMLTVYIGRHRWHLHPTQPYDHVTIIHTTMTHQYNRTATWPLIWPMSKKRNLMSSVIASRPTWKISRQTTLRQGATNVRVTWCVLEEYIWDGIMGSWPCGSHEYDNHVHVNVSV